MKIKMLFVLLVVCGYAVGQNSKALKVDTAFRCKCYEIVQLTNPARHIKYRKDCPLHNTVKDSVWYSQESIINAFPGVKASYGFEKDTARIEYEPGFVTLRFKVGGNITGLSFQAIRVWETKWHDREHKRDLMRAPGYRKLLLRIEITKDDYENSSILQERKLRIVDLTKYYSFTPFTDLY